MVRSLTRRCEGCVKPRPALRQGTARGALECTLWPVALLRAGRWAPANRPRRGRAAARARARRAGGDGPALRVAGHRPHRAGRRGRGARGRRGRAPPTGLGAGAPRRGLDTRALVRAEPALPRRPSRSPWCASRRRPRRRGARQKRSAGCARDHGWSQPGARHVDAPRHPGTHARRPVLRRHAPGDRGDAAQRTPRVAPRRSRTSGAGSSTPRSSATAERHIPGSRSSGNGGRPMGRTARCTSSSGLSSPAVRLRCSSPHPRHRWTRSHSPSGLAVTRDRLHGGAAVRGTVARDVVVEVPAPEARGTVVAMGGAGRVE